MTEQQGYLTKRVVYAIPDMAAVPVTKDITYKTIVDGSLALALYHPLTSLPTDLLPPSSSSTAKHHRKS